MQSGPRRGRGRGRSGSKARREGRPLTESKAARGLLRARPGAVRPTVDRAGTVATRSAGLLEFSATLAFSSAEEVPEGPTLPGLPRTVRCSVLETYDASENRREVLGEILALSEADLGSALETVLRSLTIAAALSDAVLETRTARVAPVRPAPAAPLQALALDVREAGFPVRFAPTWTPLADGEIGLGISGAEQELRGFLQAHPSWRVLWTPRHPSLPRKR